MKKKPKYSVIIPAKHGMPYLKYAVFSVLASEFMDLELIVSLDGSGDGSEDFLSGINDPRLKVVRPRPGLSMSEHWDFAQIHAGGEWQIFLGQDDMFMTGFATAFEFLTRAAIDQNLDIVVARRAYVSWPPLGDAKLKALQYWESGELETKDSEVFASQALLNGISYHAGPQMYTTTLVSERLISRIRLAHDGRLVLGHPQDAYLAAVLLKEGTRFLFSGNPFSWVGTSTKSAGMAIASNSIAVEAGILASDYLSSVTSSTELKYKSTVDFRHAVNSRYFLDALAVVWPSILGSKRFKSQLFRVLVDSNSWSVLAQNPKPGIRPDEMFFFRGHRGLKVFVGVAIIIWAAALSVTRQVGGFVLSRVPIRRMKFMAVNSAANDDVLFELATGIRASY